MKNEYLCRFGQKIKEIRLRQNLSQEALAKKAQVHRTYIGMIERGEKNITLLTTYKMANALQCSISYFFKDE